MKYIRWLNWKYRYSQPSLIFLRPGPVSTVALAQHFNNIVVDIIKKVFLPDFLPHRVIHAGGNDRAATPLQCRHKGIDHACLKMRS